MTNQPKTIHGDECLGKVTNPEAIYWHGKIPRRESYEVWPGDSLFMTGQKTLTNSALGVVIHDGRIFTFGSVHHRDINLF